MSEEIYMEEEQTETVESDLFYRREWGTGDTITDYGPGRRCTMPLSRCKTAQQCGDLGKIARDTHPQEEATEEMPEILLCNLCNADRLRRLATPAQYQYGWDEGFRAER